MAGGCVRIRSPEAGRSLPPAQTGNKVRHRWPHALISWNRLLEGRLGDSLVGRDVLVGVFLAGVVCILRTSTRLWGLVPSEYPEAELLQSMRSIPQTTAFLLARFFDSANIFPRSFFPFLFLQSCSSESVASHSILARSRQCLSPGVPTLRRGHRLRIRRALACGCFALRRHCRNGMWFAGRIFRAEIMLPPQGWHAGRYYVMVGAVVALALYAFTRSLGKHAFFSFKLMDQKEA